VATVQILHRFAPSRGCSGWETGKNLIATMRRPAQSRNYADLAGLSAMGDSVMSVTDRDNERCET
jgi:hypothetical protein